MNITKTLKTPLMTAALALSTAACVHALDFWNFIHGPDQAPPTYKLEINNPSALNVDLPSLGLYAPGLPTNLAPGEVLVLDLPEPDIRMVAQNLDSQSSMYPEQASFHCPSSPGSAFMLDYMHNMPDPMDPAIMVNLGVHAEFCMKNKCDMNMTPYPSSNGYISISLMDLSPPPEPN